MRANALDKRLKDLDQKYAEPVEYVLLWADEEMNWPLEPGDIGIQLKWADDFEKYRETDSDT